MTSSNLIFPPNYPNLSIDSPIIFLAGPIQGAPNWQELAIEYIQEHAPHITIASPKKNYIDATFVYAEQVDWESFFLKRASQNGCILFFLAKEAIKVDGRSYAQTTRFELGEWAAKQVYSQCHLSVGIEAGFSGARYIKRRLNLDNPSIPISETLEDCCQNAINLIQGTS